MKLDNLLKKAMANKASDIHLAVGVKPAVRINQEVKYIQMPEVTKKDITQIADKILTPDAKKVLETDHSVDLAYEDDEGHRYRVNAFHSATGVTLALRLLKGKAPTLSDLEVPGVVEALTRLNNGLILVTGPSGSGKSTTLAAMIEQINRNYNKRIITIEDPIEYRFENKKSFISQCQLDSGCTSFAGALRSILRKDPDVIMIGELRDLPTIKLALTAAETGHLVLATLHTNSATATVNRIIDSFPSAEKQLVGTILSMVLRGVVSQRLLPLIDGNGVVAAYGVMVVTTAVSNLIREGKIHQLPSAMQLGAKGGMIQMKDYVAQLVKAGKVSKEHLKALDEHKGGFDIEAAEVVTHEADEEVYKEDDF